MELEKQIQLGLPRFTSVALFQVLLGAGSPSPYIKRHGRWSGMAATKYAFDCSHLLHKLRARGSGSGRAAFSGKAVFSGMAADSFAAWPLTQLRRGRCERHGRWTHSRQRRCTMERQCRLRAAMWSLA